MIGPVGTPGAGAVRPVHLKPSGVELPVPARRQAAGEVATDAGVPPIDAARVDELRAAIAQGRFTVDAEAIAAKMIEGDLSDR